MEGKQFIPLYFDLLDSKLLEGGSWDWRGYALYLKIRRHVWRSSNHKILGAYWKAGWLAAEGYMGTWAKWLGCSRPVVSRLLSEMEDKKILYCSYKSEYAGKPNVYILGKIIFIEGSIKPSEIFFLDHLPQSEIRSDIEFLPPDDSKNPLLPSDLRNMKDFATVLPQNTTLSVQNMTLSPQNTSNKEVNKEYLILSGEKTATSIPEPELVEPGSEFDEEKPSRYAKWQHPRTALEKRIIACIARKKYWNKEDRKDNKLTQLRTIEKSISKLKPGAPIDKQPDYPEEWISACVNWYENENKTKCIPLKGFLTVVTEKPEWRARIIAEALKGKTIAIGSWGN